MNITARILMAVSIAGILMGSLTWVVTTSGVSDPRINDMFLITIISMVFGVGVFATMRFESGVQNAN